METGVPTYVCKQDRSTELILELKIIVINENDCELKKKIKMTRILYFILIRNVGVASNNKCERRVSQENVKKSNI